MSGPGNTQSNSQDEDWTAGERWHTRCDRRPPHLFDVHLSGTCRRPHAARCSAGPPDTSAMPERKRPQLLACAVDDAAGPAFSRAFGARGLGRVFASSRGVPNLKSSVISTRERTSVPLAGHQACT